jgi:NAD+ diphosphatase
MNDRSRLAGRKPMVFAGSPIDRCEIIRRDEGALAALQDDPNARVLFLHAGDPAMTRESRLDWRPLDAAVKAVMQPPLIFLGRDQQGPLFAAEAIADQIHPDTTPHIDARRAAMMLPHEETAIFAQAKSLLAWHDRHGFCANCGSPTQVAAGGAKRACPSCGAEHFPRVDPVVIMLATDGDRCLLGRQAAWPMGMWSALAGFVEPAETLEEACARELREEAGVEADIAAIRYIFTQPWPFPSSIMVGLVAPVANNAVKVDTHELEDARWFSRDELRVALEGGHPMINVPPSIAVARRLVELWVDEAI